MNFYKEYLGYFENLSYEKRLYDIAIQYHTECELYDQAICRCIDEVMKCAIPTNSHELALINIHAAKVKKRLIMENPDIPQLKINKAIGTYFP